MAVDRKTSGTSSPVTLKLYEVREQEVIIDRDLAGLYGLTTTRLNLYVKRNIHRFPSDFVFQITAEEWRGIRALQPARTGRGGLGYRPHVFTEQGVLMLAGVLRSRKAAAISIEVLRAFSRGRTSTINTEIVGNRDVFASLDHAASLPLELDAGVPVVTYFIQAGPDGPIKIGVTTKFEARFRSLAMTSPVPLRILGVVVEDIEDECHVMLMDWRLHGEWFKPAPEVLAFIAERLQTKPSLN